jgi:hypothetical protein
MLPLCSPHRSAVRKGRDAARSGALADVVVDDTAEAKGDDENEKKAAM